MTTQTLDSFIKQALAMKPEQLPTLANQMRLFAEDRASFDYLTRQLVHPDINHVVAMAALLLSTRLEAREQCVIGWIAVMNRNDAPELVRRAAIQVLIERVINHRDETAYAALEVFIQKSAENKTAYNLAIAVFGSFAQRHKAIKTLDKLKVQANGDSV